MFLILEDCNYMTTLGLILYMPYQSSFTQHHILTVKSPYLLKSWPNMEFRHNTQRIDVITLL